ncbi:GLPGLI family protein [Chryseobacterium sp. MYb264]|uniref:GLPGLI family protein n=1 Tax=Chryseobacterium sp. MYb264 TaxID=2745153 RepID=UPI002E166C2A|nr:GLPGLI family protein [Chryseobacterium sp. MYb264]
MRLLIILLFVFNYSLAQTTRFIYQYEFVPDTTLPKVISKEYMFLDIHPKESQFYSYRNYNVDSTAVAYKKKGLFYMPPNREYINFRIIKNLQNNEVNMMTKISSTVYGVSDKRKINWKITNRKGSILGHSVTSAETNFGGRNWTAWFASDISIQDGPYKFKGLPGLILKIEDDKKNHVFTAIQIVKSKNNEEYPSTENSKPTKQITQEEYKKLLTEYRKDPLKHLRGRYPDQTDSDGNFRTGEQVFRDEEKLFKNRIKKDNNMLEIDLL